MERDVSGVQPRRLRHIGMSQRFCGLGGRGHEGGNGINFDECRSI